MATKTTVCTDSIVFESVRNTGQLVILENCAFSERGIDNVGKGRVFEKPLLSIIEIMRQSVRKSIGIQRDLECGNNKSVENDEFVLISKCGNLCMTYARVIQPYLVTKHLKIGVSWDILKWVDSFGSDYRYYVKFGVFLNNLRQWGSIFGFLRHIGKNERKRV